MTRYPLVVHKFGGTSLGGAERFAAAAGLIRQASRRERIVVVASAIAGTTDALLAAAREASLGRHSGWEGIVTKLRASHLEAAKVVAPRDRRLSRGLAPLFVELDTLLRGVTLLRELSERSSDAIASFGERLSAPILAAALRAKGLDAEAVDARPIVRTDERHGKAKADLVATRRAARRSLLPKLARRTIPVVTGFIGSGPRGETTTLGRSGSDTTAAILGAVLGARRIVVWTDVDGVLTADPRIVPAARLLPRLTYREAAELTFYGAKVLHFPAMIPAIAAGIPIQVRNSFRPENPGSIIDRRGAARAVGIAAVTSIRNLATVSLEGKGMVGIPGIAARAFSAVAKERVNVLMFSQASSEQNICLVISEEDRQRSLRALRDEFALEIASRILDGVAAHGPVAAIATVGEGMRGTPGIAASIFSALARAGVNIEAIAQGSSEVNISFIVEDDDARLAVAAVHRLCIER